MNSPSNDEEDQGKVFLDESDIIQEITVDEEDLPDADEDAGSDAEVFDEADDSMHIFTGHTGELYTVVCSPTDAKLVATGGGDDKGFLWKIGQGDWAFELQGHKDSVSSLAFSTDGQLLASGSLDGLIQVWDVSAGNLKCTLEGPGGGIEWVRWHPRGHLVLAGSEDSTVWLWNADKNAYLNMFSGHASSVTCGKFTPDGKTICTGSDDAILRIWNPKNGENIHVVRGHPYHTEGLACFAISSDSTLAITGSKDNSVHFVNITTGKVFSMLDTQSLCYAAAACSFFRKCALDPLCCASIDLMTVVPKVNNLVVSTMIQRAGKTLRSIMLGLVPGPTASLGSSQPLVYSMRNSTDVSGFSWNDKRSRQGRESSILSRSCLNSLSLDTGAPGAMLRRLHLYNIERLDNTALSAALSVCPSLLDLEIVGLHVELRQTLESVSKYCHLIERLFFESSKTGRDDSLKLSPTCSDLVHNCPNLNSLALRGFKLQDFKVLALVKGFRKLKYLDFSTSYSITGVFLKKLSGGSGGNLLEVLILRDCMHLKKAEVERFISAVLAGDFKFLRHLDISNREGLASEDDWYSRCYSPSFIPIKKLYEERPGFCLLAEFPLEGSFIEVEQMISSDVDVSLPSQLSSPTSDGSFFMDTSESSYNSDQGSGNEDSRDTSFVGYEESSDEVDFLSV